MPFFGIFRPFFSELFRSKIFPYVEIGSENRPEFGSNFDFPGIPIYDYFVAVFKSGSTLRSKGGALHFWLQKSPSVFRPKGLQQQPI